MRADAGIPRAPYKRRCDRLGDTLSPQEIAVLVMLCLGHPNKVAARKLDISHRTIEIHRSNIMRKTGCDTAVQLGVWAAKKGLV